jgi:hypothetical protein
MRMYDRKLTVTQEDKEPNYATRLESKCLLGVELVLEIPVLVNKCSDIDCPSHFLRHSNSSD